MSHSLEMPAIQFEYRSLGFGEGYCLRRSIASHGNAKSTIDFFRCFRPQRFVRSVSVVPVNVEPDLLEHLVRIHRHNYPAQMLGFQGFHKPFDNCNAAIFSDCSESGLDLFPLAP